MEVNGNYIEQSGRRTKNLNKYDVFWIYSESGQYTSYI